MKHDARCLAFTGSTGSGTHSTDGAGISIIFAAWGSSALARLVASELVAVGSDGPLAAGRNHAGRTLRNSPRQGGARGLT